MDHIASRCKRQPIQHYLDQPDLPDHNYPEVPDPHSVNFAFGRQSLGYSNLMREEVGPSCWPSHYGHLWNNGELAAVAKSAWRAGDFAVLGILGGWSCRSAGAGSSPLSIKLLLSYIRALRSELQVLDVVQSATARFHAIQADLVVVSDA